MLETNVYFIIEAVRALAEDAGSLAAVGTRALPQQVFSGGVFAVVQRRLGRVPAWARPLLRVAAVAGRQVDLAVFRAITPELDSWLQVCLEATVLEVHESQWRFSHDKLREGLLASLSAQERRQLHLQIAQTVEQVHGATDAHAVTLAFHFEQAAQIPKAARFTAQAGAAALRRGALHESVALLERAKNLLEQFEAPLLDRMANLRRLSRAYYGVGRLMDCTATCRTGMAALGRAVPDTTLRRLVVLARETAVEVRNRALGAKEAADPTEKIIAAEVVALNRGTAEAFLGRMDEALLFILYSLHAAESSGQIDSQISYLSQLGYATYTVPFHRLGRLYLERAAALLLLKPQYASRSDYYPYYAYLQGAEGNWSECIPAFSTWIDQLQQSREQPLLSLAFSSRSAALLDSGRLTEAIKDAQQCEQVGRTIRSASHIGAGLAYHAGALLYRGEILTAGAMFAEAQSYIEQSSNSVGKLSIGAFWALAALRAGQTQLASKQLDKSLRRMAKDVAASFAFLDGYAAALEVALHFYLNAPSADQRAHARPRLAMALYRMSRFAHKFPIGWPRVFLAIGRLFFLHGPRHLAIQTLTLGLRAAERRGMPYEQALAHLWLGRVGQDGDGDAATKELARGHLLAAEGLMTRSGYGLDLPEVRRLLQR